MRKFISSAIKALADFIEFDDAVELGMKNGALNDLNKRILADAQREAMLERYARAWSTNAAPLMSMGQEMQLARAEVEARRRDRRRAERLRQAERQAAREMKELGFA